MKLSEVTVEDVAHYLRIEDDELDYDADALASMLDAAKSYIISYTGQTAESADLYPDLAQVALIICQDYYDNRSMYIDNSKSMISNAIKTTLGLYSVNLI